MTGRDRYSWRDSLAINPLLRADPLSVESAGQRKTADRPGNAQERDGDQEPAPRPPRPRETEPSRASNGPRGSMAAGSVC